MTGTNDELKTFWESFSTEARFLSEQVLSGNAGMAYHRIAEILDRASCDFVFELTSDDTKAHLIFTPESDPLTARLIDGFLLHAPSLPNWKLFGRRQRCDIDDAFERLERVYDVNARDAVFSTEINDDDIKVTMHCDAARILRDAEKIGFVTFFLEHALGEELTMKRISACEVNAVKPQNSLCPRELISALLQICSRQDKHV